MAKQQKTAGTPPVTGESTEDEIRSRAYQLYCKSGYQDGHDLEHWRQAEQQVLARGKAHLRRVV
jgi:hypothetical protein